MIMMKKYFNFLAVCASFAVLTFFVSCSEDEPTPDNNGNEDEDPVTSVANGMYVVGSASSETAVAGFQMGAGVTGGQDGTAARSGMFSSFFYLADGSFQFIQYTDGESTTFGGTLTEAALPDNADASYFTGTLSPDGDAITTPAAAGLYHVVVDRTSNTIVVVPVTYWEIIGPASAGGWGSGTQIPLKEASAESTVFELTGEILGTHSSDQAYKYRYNSNWDIAFDDITDFNVFTNLGFTNDAFLIGGENLALDEPGTYTINLTFSAGNPEITLTKTGDADAPTFDPANFPFGIIGAATETGWDDDTDLTYYDFASTWAGVFYLTAEQFKFRTDADWTVELNPGNVNLTSSTVAGNDDNNFFTETEGLYFVRISAVEGEEGTKWNMEIDIVNPGLIGAAVENGWDGPDNDIPAVTTSGTDLSWKVEQFEFAADAWKIRLSDGWEISFGFPDVTVTGANADLLSDDSGNFSLSTAGNYDVTLSTSDNGATWTVTFD